MSDEHWTSEKLSGADDQALGVALGAAIRERVGVPASRPPVAHIAERAAAQAKARNARRAVVGIAASAAMVAGGIAAWSALGDGQSTRLIAVDEPTVTSEPEPTTAPVEEPPDTPQDTPQTGAEARVGPVTPESLSTGPVLGWAEFDPTQFFSSDVVDVHSIVTVGDGRVLAQAYGPDGNQVMVSSDGVDWTVIPMPPDLAPERFDIAGDRWLVTGKALGGLGAFDDHRAFFSDDQGTSWTRLALDISAPDETSSVAAALVSGESIVIAVESRVHPDVASVIVARGLAPDRESIRGWTSVEGDTVSFTRDESSAPESFELTAEEEDFLYGGEQSYVRLYSSDGGAAEMAAEYPAWEVAGHGGAGGFQLAVLGTEGDLLLTSPDGRQWSQAPLATDDGVPVGRFYTYHGFTEDTVWTSGHTSSEYRFERFDGVYAPALVAELPGGISRMDRLAAGPAGVVAVALSGSVPDGDLIPEYRVAKDGYELRYNEPEGGITLWDMAADAAVYVFDAEAAQSNTPPDGVREVEGGDDGPDLLVFEDSETGEDLVAFSMDELEPWIGDESFLATAGFRPEQLEAWVGWSVDGTDWGWQTLSEAFGLTGLADADKEYTDVELAVGSDFVIARVQPYDADPPGTPTEDAIMLTGQTPRWFIATAQ